MLCSPHTPVALLPSVNFTRCLYSASYRVYLTAICYYCWRPVRCQLIPMLPKQLLVLAFPSSRMCILHCGCNHLKLLYILTVSCTKDFYCHVVQCHHDLHLLLVHSTGISGGPSLRARHRVFTTLHQPDSQIHPISTQMPATISSFCSTTR